MKTKNNIFGRYLEEYLKTDRKRKGEILDNVCDTTGITRKAAIKKFKRLQFRDPYQQETRGRKTYYTSDVSLALKKIWEAASNICGELLIETIPDYVEIFKRDKMWEFTEETTLKLLEISEGTVKRRVSNFNKLKIPKKGISSTKPSALKELIPVFTGPWTDKPPGFGQIDTVVHCGSTLCGDMAYTVNYTDVNVLWVSLYAQWNKGMMATRESLRRISQKVPFSILGMHPDTGSEFINKFVKEWCEEENIKLSRSRPYHKNDNGYVEQKNGHVVRRFLEYDRFDCKEVIPVMNKLYDILELYLNHFVPSRKCIEKMKIGSKYKRKYDKAKTAYKRVLECSNEQIPKDVKTKLEEEHKNLNPLLLKEEVDRLIEEVLKIQKYYGNSRGSSS